MRADKLSSLRGLGSFVVSAAMVFAAMALLGFIIGLGLDVVYDNYDSLRNALAVKHRCPRWSTRF